jgi:hypothetical protein
MSLSHVSRYYKEDDALFSGLVDDLRDQILEIYQDKHDIVQVTEMTYLACALKLEPDYSQKGKHKK